MKKKWTIDFSALTNKAQAYVENYQLNTCKILIRTLKKSRRTEKSFFNFMNVLLAVYVAETTGSTSPLVTIQVITSFVDPPNRLKVLSSTKNKWVLQNKFILYKIPVAARALELQNCRVAVP